MSNICLRFLSVIDHKVYIGWKHFRNLLNSEVISICWINPSNMADDWSIASLHAGLAGPNFWVFFVIEGAISTIRNAMFAETAKTVF
jgi:hypothetical protein